MNEIRLQNFRCYSDITVTFRRGVNLIIGDNATGKTSLLKACKYVASSFFCGFSDENTKWLNPSNDDFMQNAVNDILLNENPLSISFNISDMIAYPDLLYSHTNMPENHTLVKNSKKNSRALTGGIKSYKDYAARMINTYMNENGQQLALPLFAAFFTGNIRTRKIDISKFKQYRHKPSFGYYGCLESNDFFTYWTKRLLVMQEGRDNHQEIMIVKRAITDALGEAGCGIITDMHIRPNIGKIFYIFRDGREIETELLSDGYRRIINIVTELAFRCAILNRGIFGNDACRHTQGTVLIDEIDLHLHPSLQSVILKGLRNAFPRVQFIVTSHAPMVMSGVRTNDNDIVYKLDYTPEHGYTITTVETYGMDVSTLTDIVLNQTPRAREVDEQLQELFNLIDSERYYEARQLLSRLRNIYHDRIPELAQAEAMLNCIIE